VLRWEIGRSWLASAKIARKAGHISTAYSALLQAKHHQTPYAFVQAAKLVRAKGENERALRDLEHSLVLAEQSEDIIDLTDDVAMDDDAKRMLKAKVGMQRHLISPAESGLGPLAMLSLDD
jgi:serine/threonine-protein kinase ATR